jgi:hypothetical protein
MAAWLLGRLLAGASALQSTCALSEDARPAAAVSEQDASNPDQGTGPEGDVLNRQRPLQLMYQVKTAPGTDLNGNPVTTTTDTWRLRGDVGRRAQMGPLGKDRSRGRSRHSIASVQWSLRPQRTLAQPSAGPVSLQFDGLASSPPKWLGAEVSGSPSL